MTKKEFMKQASEGAGLQYDLWRKFPSYVHLDFTLSVDRDGKEGVRYNIYTPELGHNNHNDFQGFICFLGRVIKNGVLDVRKKILTERLRKAQTTKVDAIDVIYDTQKELDKLPQR